MRVLKYFINLVLVFIVIIFFIENSPQLSQRIQFQFDLFIPGMLWHMPELPLYFLLLMFFAMGGVITTIIFVMGRITISYKLIQANRKIRGLEKEISAYRQLPLGPGENMLKNDTLKKDESKPAPGPLEV